MLVTPADFVPGVVPHNPAPEGSWVCVLRKMQVLVFADNGQLAPAQLAWTVFGRQGEPLYLGRRGEQGCWLIIVPDHTPAPQGLEWRGLRPLLAILEEAELFLLSRALQIAQWRQTHRFCGACGQPTIEVPGERARHCPHCEITAYPRLSPAIMVLVTTGRELLLARSARFKLPMWSALAGFVEPGESLEDTLHREVREEVGIEVSDLTYFGSQSWPFPHSLMVAFTAHYAGGTLRPDGEEIVEAAWFHPETLPPLPSKTSIARLLIDTVAGALATSPPIP